MAQILVVLVGEGVEESNPGVRVLVTSKNSLHFLTPALSRYTLIVRCLLIRSSRLDNLTLMLHELAERANKWFRGERLVAKSCA